MGDSKHIFDLPITCLPPSPVQKLEGGWYFGAQNQCVMRPRQLPADGDLFSFTQDSVCVCLCVFVSCGEGSPLDQTQVLKERYNSGSLGGVPEDSYHIKLRTVCIFLGRGSTFVWLSKQLSVAPSIFLSPHQLPPHPRYKFPQLAEVLGTEWLSFVSPNEDWGP